MLQVGILGRRRPDVTHDQFTAYWRAVHAQIGCRRAKPDPLTHNEPEI
jgi:hypothetical protein